MPQFIAGKSRAPRCRISGYAGVVLRPSWRRAIHHHVQPPTGVDGRAWLAAHGEDASPARIVYTHVLELGGSISGRTWYRADEARDARRTRQPARLAALRAVKERTRSAGAIQSRQVGRPKRPWPNACAAPRLPIRRAIIRLRPRSLWGRQSGVSPWPLRPPTTCPFLWRHRPAFERRPCADFRARPLAEAKFLVGQHAIPLTADEFTSACR